MGEGTVNQEGPFFRRFFDLLNESRLRYAVLRNWELLPDSLGGSDLDLLTDSTESARAVLGLAEQAAKEHGGMITSLYSVEATVLTLAGRENNGAWWGLHIDIFSGLTYFGIPYFSTTDVLDEAIFEDGRFYRCSSLGDVVAFLKECLHNKRTKKDYYTCACSAYRKNPGSIAKAFQGYYSNECGNLFLGLFEKECSPAEIRRVARILVKGLRAKYFLSTSWYRFLRVKAGNIFRRSLRTCKPPGYCVAFLGTDGAGKSCIISEVKPFLTRMMHSKTVYEHLRPNLLPAIAQLFGKPCSIGPTTDPHAGKVSGRAGSLARVLYYAVDYCLGYWVKIYPIIVKRPTIVVFDRYFYDYLIDPKRSCVNMPKLVIEFISVFIPAPDLVVCLGTDPGTIHTRKPELPYREIARQVGELQAFSGKNTRAVWIDTGCSIEESVNKTLDVITSRMADRY